MNSDDLMLCILNDFKYALKTQKCGEDVYVYGVDTSGKIAYKIYAVDWVPFLRNKLHCKVEKDCAAMLEDYGKTGWKRTEVLATLQLSKHYGESATELMQHLTHKAHEVITKLIGDIDLPTLEYGGAKDMDLLQSVSIDVYLVRRNRSLHEMVDIVRECRDVIDYITVEEVKSYLDRETINYQDEPVVSSLVLSVDGTLKYTFSLVSTDMLTVKQLYG